MKNRISISERLAGMVVAAALFVVGLGFMVVGVSFLPVIGILIGFVCFRSAMHFLNPRATLNERPAGFVVPDSVRFQAA
ncbi:MAG: hypothetical protein ACLQBD_15835 [Syntrophobacteraceae bacterium]